jgi:hypothetical protein
MALIVWFRSPHRDMPNLFLDPRRPNRDDEIEYVVSLRDGKWESRRGGMLGMPPAALNQTKDSVVS